MPILTKEKNDFFIFANMQPLNRHQIATIIALAFHISGFIAIAFFHSADFLSKTPLNILVCLALIFYTQNKISFSFIAFCVAGFIIGFATEAIGVNTGVLFGHYAYSDLLGPKWKGVPWLIGVQWVVTLYCIGVGMHMLKTYLLERQPNAFLKFPKWWVTLSVIGDGALLAVLFDWIMEPAAIDMGLWKWQNNQIPFLNYFSWWAVSMVLLIIFHFLPFKKHNLFAIHLFMIQMMFFLLVRTFY